MAAILSFVYADPYAEKDKSLAGLANFLSNPTAISNSPCWDEDHTASGQGRRPPRGDLGRTGLLNKSENESSACCRRDASAIESLLNKQQAYLLTANATLFKKFAEPRVTITMTTELSFATVADLAKRLVRYAELRPCRNAFIDTRSPGSEDKENFTIIGPGVSENPAQFVHIEEPHGYNIGGARQPPHCVNSQHSHDTAEVFVVHNGNWRFDFGEHGDDARLEAGPGDVVSFPTKAFRGFTNIGDGPGFLWSVLGGDDPGRVTWAPSVFVMAKNYGLVLMENGSLVDTAAGQGLPSGVAPMRATTTADVAALQRLTPADTEGVIARDCATRGVKERLVIGHGGLLEPTDHFILRRSDLAEGEQIVEAGSERQEVLFVHHGAIAVEAKDGEVMLGEGDTLSLPVGTPRRYRAAKPTALFRVNAR